MMVVADSLQRLCVVAVAAYLLARIDFFDEAPDRPRTRTKWAAVWFIFSLVACTGTLTHWMTGAVPLADTKTLGVALAGLLFGGGAAFGVAATAGIVALAEGARTLTADLVALVVTAAACAAVYRRRAPRDSVLYGAFTGLLEIAHMLLIVALVRPVAEAKEIVYQIAFSMIILDGCAVMVFTMILNDIRDRRQLAAREARVHAELAIARRIQMGLLDTRFALDPRGDFHAFLEPAAEVGGDLYSFRKLGDRLYFILGDVSGKGVPAAITMSRTVALFQLHTREDASPTEILAAMNDALAVNNPAQVFVTALAGCLNLATGQLDYASAGHPAPVLSHAGAPARVLPKPRGMALGILPGRVCAVESISLAPGDLLLVYTDGISEAERADHAQFGVARILDALSSAAAPTARDTAEHIFHSVRDFAQGTPQSDDIAMCLLRRPVTAATPPLADGRPE